MNVVSVFVVENDFLNQIDYKKKVTIYHVVNSNFWTRIPLVR